MDNYDNLKRLYKALRLGDEQTNRDRVNYNINRETGGYYREPIEDDYEIDKQNYKQFRRTFLRFHSEMCPAALPINGEVLFQYCWDKLYRKYTYVGIDEFFDVVYDVLGGAPYRRREGMSKGIYMKFDPSKVDYPKHIWFVFREYFATAFKREFYRHYPIKPPKLPYREKVVIPPKMRDALDWALEQLADENPINHKIIEMHYYENVTIKAIAYALHIGRRTAIRRHMESLDQLRNFIKDYF